MHVTIEQHQVRYGGMLIVRGAIALVLALLSLLNPETVFLNALLGVASLLIAFGIYEIVNAVRIRRVSRHQWWLPLLDGGAAASFGLISVGLTMVSMNAALWLIGAWFFAYALFLTLAALLLKGREKVSHTLFLVGFFHALGGCLIVLMPVHPRLSILALPSLGGAYVMGFGLWQIGAGSWLVNNARNAPENELFLAPHLA